MNPRSNELRIPFGPSEEATYRFALQRTGSVTNLLSFLGYKSHRTYQWKIHGITLVELKVLQQLAYERSSHQIPQIQGT